MTEKINAWTRKKLIRMCKELSQHFILMGCEFTQLSKSLEQNKPTPDIKKFVESRYKAMGLEK